MVDKEVFVVSRGERSEGGSIISVYKHEKDATKAALAVEYYGEDGWIIIPERKLGPKLRFYAENGCDFVKVECWKVG